MTLRDGKIGEGLRDAGKSLFKHRICGKDLLRFQPNDWNNHGVSENTAKILQLQMTNLFPKQEKWTQAPTVIQIINTNQNTNTNEYVKASQTYSAPPPLQAPVEAVASKKETVVQKKDCTPKRTTTATTKRKEVAPNKKKSTKKKASEPKKKEASPNKIIAIKKKESAPKKRDAQKRSKSKRAAPRISTPITLPTRTTTNINQTSFGAIHAGAAVGRQAYQNAPEDKDLSPFIFLYCLGVLCIYWFDGWGWWIGMLFLLLFSMPEGKSDDQINGHLLLFSVGVLCILYWKMWAGLVLIFVFGIGGKVKKSN